MKNYNGVLNANAIQSALFNMIISQDILGGKIKANYNLVDKAKDEAGLYGDTKLYIDTPTVDPVDWVQDSEEAVNLLALHRPAAPKTQSLVIDVFKQAAITKDAILSKQAFATEGAFAAYIGVLESRLPKSKEMYLNRTYNTFLGTVTNTATVNEYEINTAADGNSMGENIAYSLQNLIDDMKDYNTKYTPNGFERAFGDEDIHIVWNTKYLNAVKKIDLPSVFHSDKLAASFVGDKLPSRYFGDVNSAEVAIADNDGTYQAVRDTMYGDVLVKASTFIPTGVKIPAGAGYKVNDKIICKIFTKLPPMLEAFSVGTDFYNARNLSTNLYLTFGHNTLEALESEAVITVVDTAE